MDFELKFGKAKITKKTHPLVQDPQNKWSHLISTLDIITHYN